MTFSGKWAIQWHDMTWGPFDRQDQAEFTMKQLGKYPRAPQEFHVIPLWDPDFIQDVARKHEA